MHTSHRICLQVTLRLICSKIRVNLFLPTSSFLYTKGFGKTSRFGGWNPSQVIIVGWLFASPPLLGATRGEPSPLTAGQCLKQQAAAEGFARGSSTRQHPCFLSPWHTLIFIVPNSKVTCSSPSSAAGANSRTKLRFGTSLTHGRRCTQSRDGGGWARCEADTGPASRCRAQPGWEGSSKIAPIRNGPAWPQAQKQKPQSLWGKAASLGLLSSPSQPRQYQLML